MKTDTLLQDALKSFRISTREEQIAMIENMFFEGLFTKDMMWECVHQMPPVFGTDKATKPEEIFNHLTHVMKQAHAFSGNPKDFNATFVLDHLFSADNKFVDPQDVQDWLLFCKQKSFGRSIDMERFDLPKSSRITTDEHITQRYTANAGTLGMLDEVKPPADTTYDATWVQGAARVRIGTRLNYLKGLIDNGKVQPGNITMVTGKRDVYAPFDGIKGDGISYILQLADKLGVPYEGSPYDRNETDESVLKDRYFTNKLSSTGKDRFFLKYIPGERTLSEADIAQDMLAQSGIRAGVTSVTQTAAVGALHRPTTETSSADAADALIARIQAGEFGERKDIHILNVTDQPYIPRMAIQAQLIIDEKLKAAGLDGPEGYCVTVDTVGEGKNRDSIEIAKSDSAALAAQQYRRAVSGQPRKREMETLMSSGMDTTNALPSLAKHERHHIHRAVIDEIAETMRRAQEGMGSFASHHCSIRRHERTNASVRQ